ncbi:MAG TPA: response regulator [bacterium]|nr:response regulator [bacterium]
MRRKRIDRPPPPSDGTAGGFRLDAPPVSGRLAAMIAEPLLLVDTQTRTILDGNPAAEKLYARARSELRGLPLDAVVVASPPGAGREGLARRRQTHRRLDGSLFPAEVSLSGFTLGGHPVAALLVRDVGRSRTRKLQVAGGRGLLAGLLENLPVGVFAKDLGDDGRYLLWNEKAVELTGIPAEEILGRTDLEIFGPELADAFRETDMKAVRTRKVLDLGEEPLLYSQGAGIAQTFKVPIVDENGSPVVILGLMDDITERRRMERELHHSDKMRALGQLAGGLAHDFNNQLSAILGYAEILTRELEPGELLECARWIMTGAERASDLIQQLLAFSPTQHRSLIPADVHQAAREAAALLSRAIDKKIEIALDLDASDRVVRGDFSQLRNLVLNLGLNARDAMPGGGSMKIATADAVFSSGDPSVNPDGIKDGRYLELRVEDTGPGVPPELSKRIFEPFFTTRPKRSGLGLSAVYGTVKAHGGGIVVAAGAAGGASFRVYLPVEPPIPAEPAAEVAPGTVRILLVEDEDSVRGMLVTLFRNEGFQVTAARNGQQALELLEAAEAAPDLAILDMNMPVMSGEETQARLRERYPGLRIVILSGYSSGEMADRVVECGISDYIRKPVRGTELLARVRAVLARS